MRMNEADAIREAAETLTDAIYELASPGAAGALEAIEAAAQARRDLEDTIAQAVRDEHAAGTTWAAIGAALGVSAQAAHKRYSAE